MARVWVSGEFEGWYRGERAEVAVGNHGKRVYTLRLYKGFLDAPTITEPPQLQNGLFDAPNTFRQSELQITMRNAAKTFTLNDLRIHNWRTAFQTEDQGEVFGTIFGTAYGWIDDGRQPPPPPVPAAPQPAMTVRIAKSRKASPFRLRGSRLLRSHRLQTPVSGSIEAPGSARSTSPFRRQRAVQ
jgi:hypothetical protein